MNGMETTIIKVSRKTLEMLRFYRDKLGAHSYDEVIQVLLKEYRRLIDQYFGVDKSRISSFTEEDRLEDRKI